MKENMIVGKKRKGNPKEFTELKINLLPHLFDDRNDFKFLFSCFPYTVLGSIQAW